MNFEVSVESSENGQLLLRQRAHGEALSIGREPSCSIRLPAGDYVSRVHAWVHECLHAEPLGTR